MPKQKKLQHNNNNTGGGVVAIRNNATQSLRHSHFVALFVSFHGLCTRLSQLKNYNSENPNPFTFFFVLLSVYVKGVFSSIRAYKTADEPLLNRNGIQKSLEGGNRCKEETIWGGGFRDSGSSVKRRNAGGVHGRFRFRSPSFFIFFLIIYYPS